MPFWRYTPFFFSFCSTISLIATTEKTAKTAFAQFSLITHNHLIDNLHSRTPSGDATEPLSLEFRLDETMTITFCTIARVHVELQLFIDRVAAKFTAAYQDQSVQPIAGSLNKSTELVDRLIDQVVTTLSQQIARPVSSVLAAVIERQKGNKPSSTPAIAAVATAAMAQANADSPTKQAATTNTFAQLVSSFWVAKKVATPQLSPAELNRMAVAELDPVFSFVDSNINVLSVCQTDTQLAALDLVHQFSQQLFAEVMTNIKTTLFGAVSRGPAAAAAAAVPAIVPATSSSTTSDIVVNDQVLHVIAALVRWFVQRVPPANNNFGWTQHIHHWMLLPTNKLITMVFDKASIVFFNK